MTLNCFGFAHSIEEEKEIYRENRNESFDYPQYHNDELTEMIFAPDPITGNPCSALGALLKGNNEKVREVIRTHFMNDVGTGTSGIDDPDIAIRLLKSRQETREQYLDRLAEAINEFSNEDR